MSCSDENSEAEQYTQRLLIQISCRLRKYRRAHRLTIQDAANRCGIERSNLSRIESGKINVSIRMLCRICVGLGTDLQTLLAQPVSITGFGDIPDNDARRDSNLSEPENRTDITD